MQQSSDFLWYYQAGLHIAAGQGYSEHGVLTAYWPVGWPGVLGILFWWFGPDAIIGKLANLVFSALIFLLTLAIARRFFGDRLVARIAVLLLAVYPNQIAYIPALATEPLYEFLLLLAVWLLSRKRIGWAVLAGIAFGAASLTKAQTPPLPIVLLCGVWLLDKPRPRIRALASRIAVVVTAMILVLAPWTIRNYAVFGTFVPISTGGGLTFLEGNNPDAQGCGNRNVPLVEALSPDPRQQIATDRLARAEAWHWIKDHPFQFVALLPQKLWHLWARDGEGEWLFEIGYPGFTAQKLVFDALRMVNQLYYFALLALAAASLVPCARQFRRQSSWALCGWILVAYFTAISLVFVGEPRYHYPLMPWIAIYAAVAIARWLRANKAAAAPEGPIGSDRPPPDLCFAEG